MGSFVRWADEIDRLSRSELGSLRKNLFLWLNATRQRWRAETTRAVATATALFPPAARVMTLSRSEAVYRTLVSLPIGVAPTRAIVLRSLPGGEGIRAARELSIQGIAVSLVDDAGAHSLVRDVDLILVGADAIYRDGSLVHKIGTRPLAQTASRLGVPLMVVSGLSKWVDRSRPPRPLPRWFDRTPARWIRGYWTDGGFLRPGDLARHMRTEVLDFRRSS